MKLFWPLLLLVIGFPSTPLSLAQSEETPARGVAERFLACGRTLRQSQAPGNSEVHLKAQLQALERCTRPLFALQMSARNRTRLTQTLLLIEGASAPALCRHFPEAQERFLGLPQIAPSAPSIDLCFRFELRDGDSRGTVRKLGLITLVPGLPTPKIARLVY